MPAFIDTLYNGFTSVAEQQRQPKKAFRRLIIPQQTELLKVRAPRYDLDRFDVAAVKIKRDTGINVDIDVVVPREEISKNVKRRLEEKEGKEGERKNKTDIEETKKMSSAADYDFLDQIFSDTIPFFHDLLTYGSPETQFVQVKGSSESIDAFNKLIKHAIYEKGWQCQVEVIDRREIPIPRDVSENNNNDCCHVVGVPRQSPPKENALSSDSVLSVDFSNMGPCLNRLLTAPCSFA